jgi:hypothetical protein
MGAPAELERRRFLNDQKQGYRLPENGKVFKPKRQQLEESCD